MLQLSAQTGKFLYFLRALCFFRTQQSIFIHCFACRYIKAPDSRLSVGKAVHAESDTALLRRACQRSEGQTADRLRFRSSANSNRLLTDRFRLRTNRRRKLVRLCKSAYRYRFFAFRLRPKSERRRRCARRVCISACRHCRCPGRIGISSYRRSIISARIGRDTESSRAGSAGNGIGSRRCGSCSRCFSRHAESARLYTVRVRVGSYRRTVIALRARVRSDRYRSDPFCAVILPVRSLRVGAVIGMNREIVNFGIRVRCYRRSLRIGETACGQQGQNHYGRHCFFTAA